MPIKHNNTIQRKFLWKLFLVAFCGIVLSAGGIFVIQTIIARSSADAMSLSRLGDVESRMAANVQRLEELSEVVKEDNLSRARALAMLIEMEPEVVEDVDKLVEIAAAFDADEIHVIDEDGILRWGTQPYNFGLDFSLNEQTRPFLDILKDPSLEVSQVPMPNAAQGVMRQYTGVALKNPKGIVQVGVIPHRLLEVLDDTLIEKVLANVTLGNTGYMFSISVKTGLISSHPNPDLIGSRLPKTLGTSGFALVDGQNVLYHTRLTPDELLVTALPTSEIYRQRLISTGIFFLFMSLLFAVSAFIINLQIKRIVISDIHHILGTLDRITGGDLEATAEVRSCFEFSRLSDGINHMLSSINSKMAEVSQAMVAAEEASRAKSSFLASMSHEIRTPMNGILGMTDLMLGENLQGRQLQYIKDVKASAESLLGIINDILDFSKISEGKLQILPVDIDIATLLKNVVSIMSFSARSKGLEFIDDIQLNTPEYVRIDDVRIKQIILNLLSNAVKFTKEGHVKLMVKIDGEELLFEVSDTGIGIKPEDLPLIFIAFEQADKHRNRAIKGTGLGLSITKNLIELMGGKIWLESEYGTGTKFFVTIPYIPGDESAVEPLNMEFHYICAPTAQVLLVDDIQTNLTVGAGLLRMCGITADVALSGREAIELVKTKDYDVVFMDHMMPEMDGVEAMRRIRGLGGQYQDLPIIALTANAINESRDLLLESGMDDFLSKPIDKTTLMALLQKWLPPDKIEPELKSAKSPHSSELTAILEEAAKIDGLDIELALNRIGGMQDVLETSMKQVALSIKERLGKMDSFLLEENLSGFAIEAHGLKGALANIGATRHSELSAELEIASKAKNLQLCQNKFSEFSDFLCEFANKLQPIFQPKKTQGKPRGDASLLDALVNESIHFLNAFEADEAKERIDRLSSFTFGEDTDALLEEAKTAAEAFGYKKAVRLLERIVR